jgi:hypothetical protein
MYVYCLVRLEGQNHRSFSASFVAKEEEEKILAFIVPTRRKNIQQKNDRILILVNIYLLRS